ncbi:uncharacterized protein LOC122261885 [Penaeus japonicus]|uniref:uncharacterized protein LOC122261885 n=1 Tax=Penaeus japonicus TaxID=27405 RepID=UPI001C70F4D8|nr:uncharacterized protein LOC122261885 [Penaeus japonicus]
MARSIFFFLCILCLIWMSAANVSVEKSCDKDQASEVANGLIMCSFSSCKIKCNAGYKFKGGKRRIYIKCNQDTGQFTYNGKPWRQSVPECVPNCRNGCHNGGTCMAPNQCQCSLGYKGKKCEVKECPEPSFPDAQANITRDNDELRVECHEGYVLPPGTAPGGVTFCREGAWDLPDDFRCLPDCGSLGCQNGGSCVAPGRCSCAPGLAGDDCPRNMCPDILALNGNIVVTPVSLRVKCHKGYKLASRKDTIEAECQAGQWTVPPEDLQDDIIACLPNCGSGCQNGGACIAPSQCQCSPGFKGETCEVKECPEPSFPDAQASIVRTDDELRVECHEGYVLPPGTAPGGVAVCRNGAWDLPDNFRCQPDCGTLGCQRKMCPDMLALNGNIVVTPVSLKVKCHEKYAFRSGKNVMEAECQAGQWTVPPEDIQGDRVVCFPNCGSGCQNGGTCIAPSQCQCSPGFKGETCEVKECPEPSFPDAQASIVRTDDELRVECHEGYVLPPGTAPGGVAVCRDGAWDLPDDFRCQPSCGRLGCQNGGRCVAPNKCQCEDQFTGEHCQVRRCKEPQVRTVNISLTINETHLTAECEPGHVFPDGDAVVTMPCQNGEWHSEEGIVADNSTLQCAAQDKPCYYPSKTFNNTIMEGDLFSHTLKCPQGFRMKDGRESVALECLEAEWNVQGQGLLQDLDLHCYPLVRSQKLLSVDSRVSKAREGPPMTKEQVHSATVQRKETYGSSRHRLGEKLRAYATNIISIKIKDTNQVGLERICIKVSGPGQSQGLANAAIYHTVEITSDLSPLKSNWPSWTSEARDPMLSPLCGRLLILEQPVWLEWDLGSMGLNQDYDTLRCCFGKYQEMLAVFPADGRRISILYKCSSLKTGLWSLYRYTSGIKVDLGTSRMKIAGIKSSSTAISERRHREKHVGDEVPKASNVVQKKLVHPQAGNMACLDNHELNDQCEDIGNKYLQWVTKHSCRDAGTQFDVDGICHGSCRGMACVQANELASKQDSVSGNGVDGDILLVPSNLVMVVIGWKVEFIFVVKVLVGKTLDVICELSGRGDCAGDEAGFSSSRGWPVHASPPWSDPGVNMAGTKIFFFLYILCMIALPAAGASYKRCAKDQASEVTNGQIMCSFSGCRLECASEYKLQGGKRRIYITCNQDTGQFMYNNKPWRQTAPKCVPYCRKGCQNGGTCIAPSQCQCSPGFKGETCEVKECPEPSFPDAQASIVRTDDELRVECHEGYVLPPGTAPGGVAVCRDGAWDLPDDFRCQPHCGSGCQNGGTCIAPSQCQCGPGFKGETCEVKECPEPSFPDAQANFTRDNDELRVECHEGYVLPPGTAPGGVAVCRDGAWDLPDDFRCQPSCGSGCQNGGTCIAPSQCQCGPGFKGETCEVKECPEPSFPDAQASIVRTDDELRVECHEGYVLPPGTAPGGVAVCRDGAWDLPDDFRCQPNCGSGCQNGGTCIAPSQCQCGPGFKGETCEVKECPEPSFPDAQASIVRTDDELQVECHEGYVLPPGTAPGGVAVCRDGAWDLPDDFRCQPNCGSGCQNGGTCIAPSQCQCGPGFKGETCEVKECPEPSFPDAQASIVRTDDELRVECHEGYVLPPGTAPGGVAVCRDGAWDLPDDFRCQPNCSNECQNGGTCIAPSQCQCSPGFKGETCEVKECPEPSFPDAQASIVRTDDELRVECHEGYVLPPGTAPGGVAVCRDGAWDLPDDFRCQPSCGSGCQNGGTCIAPSQCQCSPGFKGETCEVKECPEPSFPDAQASIVRTDDELRVECHEGYVLPPGTAPGGVAVCRDGAWDLPDDFRCQPHCGSGCQNGGTCIAPSQCQCGPGFKGETCEVKECPEPSFPDAQASIVRTDDELRVECHEGYVLPPGTAPGGVAVCRDGAWDLPDDFRCQPNCGSGCQNGGTCIAPSQCQCSPGFKGETCEVKECPEPSFPDAQASIVRTDDELRVECHEGYVLPPGTAPGGVAVCRDGAWDLPDDFRCQSNCGSGCQNGGTCIAPSQCQCGPGFKGETCEVKECPEPSFPDAQASIVRTDDELRVECHEGYVLPPGTAPGGVAVCRDGAWDLPDDFRCQPNCGSGCQNGGTCIAPSQCQCGPGFKGETCEVKECPEPSFPDAQASIVRTDDELRVECHEGYVLPPGTAPGGVAVCRDGAWDLPDDFRCQPNCSNECQNGGTCIAPSQCQCSPGFKGETCEVKECPEPSFPDAQANFTRDNDELRVECHEGYVLPPDTAPGGVAVCMNGTWDLPDDFRCQPQPCYYPSRSFKNTIMEGDLFSHTLKCPQGFRMKDGRESVALECLEAEWNVQGQGLLQDLDLHCYRKE